MPMDQFQDLDLIELSYVSLATQDMGMLALMRILNESWSWNVRHQITGILFYENQHFGQILEGRKVDVLKIWEKIKTDSRHQVLRQIAVKPIKKRHFPNWVLRFCGGDEILKRAPRLIEILDGMPENDVEILELMRSLSDSSLVWEDRSSFKKFEL